MKRYLILNENYLQKIIKGPVLIKTGSDRNVFALRILIKLLMFCFKYHYDISFGVKMKAMSMIKCTKLFGIS